jgi:hypothetical protein
VKRRKRTEISFEVEQVLVIRRRHPTAPAWCAECGALVEMLRPEEAAVLTGRSVRQICRQVEAGALHFIESADGALLICANSLGHTNN